MSDASFELALQELRDTAPRAPDRLRELVRSMPSGERPRPLRLRPALALAAAIAIAVGLGAAAIGGLTGGRTGAGGQRALSPASKRSTELRAVPLPSALPSGLQSSTGQANRFAPSLTAKSRLQRQDVTMSLRVKDLSGATQSAVRTTRRLGGYVAGADYSTGSSSGNSRLSLRVPVQNLQQAIARFTQLGTILSQHISVTDLQASLDRLDARIAAARHAGRTRAATRLERQREALVQEGTYAKVSLLLTTSKPAAQHVAPGRFDRFWDNASSILGKEAIAVLYALVVAGPFLLLATLLFFAERTRRRRADHRLLEETG